MSNPATFLEHTESYRRDLRRVEFGDERDPEMRAFLERIAPMNNSTKIKKPMLVVAGKNDPRCLSAKAIRLLLRCRNKALPSGTSSPNTKGTASERRRTWITSSTLPSSFYSTIY